jgi:hypothetical protein
MSETIAPCPACGWTHNDVHDGFRTCRNCGFDAACVNFGGVLGWDDLSRAAALLRACDTFGPLLPSGWAFGVAQIWDDDTQQWCVEAQAIDRAKGRILVALAATPAEAFIAVAAKTREDHANG